MSARTPRRTRSRALFALAVGATLAIAVACAPPPDDPGVPTSSTSSTTTAPEGACPPGFFDPEDGIAPCTPAPGGTFVDAIGALQATPCPLGRFQPSVAQTSCLLAPIGSYVDTVAAVAAVECPVGTTTTFLGASSEDDCQPI